MAWVAVDARLSEVQCLAPLGSDMLFMNCSTCLAGPLAQLQPVRSAAEGACTGRQDINVAEPCWIACILFGLHAAQLTNCEASHGNVHSIKQLATFNWPLLHCFRLNCLQVPASRV